MRISPPPLLLPLLRLLQNNAPGVESAAWMDMIASCGTSGQKEICATQSFVTPSPCMTTLPNGTEVLEYVGGYGTTFQYLDGVVADGTDISNLEDPPAFNGVRISVLLDDNGICKTTVDNNGNEMDCASCTYCGRDDFNYAIDCTNVKINENMVFTRALTCDESILPVLFPLDKNDGNTKVVKVLPPGYEDTVYCPPSTCKFYTNPQGLVGPLSSFNKCLDPSSGQVTEGVWTGSLTNVTAPEGWVKEPAECAECATDLDCFPKMRTRVPTQHKLTGARRCKCYASSDIEPIFDECQGEAGTGFCAIAQCKADFCAGLEAYCEQDVGVCSLREGAAIPPESTPVPNPSTSTTAATTAVTTASAATTTSAATKTAECTTDQDCFTKMRTRVPTLTSLIGARRCKCYASLKIEPFDECQGELGTGFCATAQCNADFCAGLEAYCEQDVGVCSLREGAAIPPESTPTVSSSAVEPQPKPSEVKSVQSACLTQEECDNMRQELGFNSLFIGTWPSKGCFYKGDNAFFGEGGTIDEMSKPNLPGIQVRIWCNDTGSLSLSNAMASESILTYPNKASENSSPSFLLNMMVTSFILYSIWK